MMNTKLEAVTAITTLRPFIGRGQLQVVGDLCRGADRQFFIDKLVELAARVASMPRVYEQDGAGDQAIAHLHYFGGACDFYITERDTTAEQLQAFGSANLGYGPELGYINIAEITAGGMELDFHFTPRPLAQLKGHDHDQSTA
jgi:hypothetical protein